MTHTTTGRSAARIVAAALAATVTSTLVLVGAGSPAQAQTKTRHDAAGDADRTYDLRAVTVRNGRQDLVVRLRVADVRRDQTGALFTLNHTGTTSETGYLVESKPRRDGQWRTILTRFDETDVAPTRCDGLRTEARPGRGGVLRVVIPQSCLTAEAGTQSVTLWTYGKHGPLGEDPRHQDDADAFDHPVTVRRG